MSKVYKVGDVFYDKGLKCYVKAVASDSDVCDKDDCALNANSSSCYDVEQCLGIRFVRVPAPKCSVSFNQESAWAIKPSKETIASIMAKGERMANSIMGFNSKEVEMSDLEIVIENRLFGPWPKLKITSAVVSTKSNKFIVSLLENSVLQPSTNPKIHETEKSAEMEAERLCRLHNQEFVILKVTASFKPQQPKKEVFA